MKSILYFVLLVVALGSLSLFAVEQFEEKKIESVHKNENVGVRKQDLLSSTNQKDELKSNVDAKQTQEAESKRVTDKEKLKQNENKVSVVEKTISEGERIDKDLPNDQLEESTGEFARNLPNVANKEVNKDLKPEPLPLSADLNENTTDPQKNLQADQKIDIKDNELSKNDASQLLEGKKEKVENQFEEKKVKETNNNSKNRNRVKPITKKDEEEQSEKKNLQKWTKLNREPIKEWGHKDIQSKSIYKRQYDSLNEHLPTTVFIDDYSKQFFYCIKKNNLPCLRGIMSKLEKIGLTTQEILRFRNKLGDTPLIYSVKQGEVEIVRFLLLQGADLRVVNNNFQSPIDIAIEKKQINIINAIAEMMPHLLEDRKIDNKESSAMYGWAVKTKENNESQCDKQDD